MRRTRTIKFVNFFILILSNKGSDCVRNINEKEMFRSTRVDDPMMKLGRHDEKLS